MPKVSVIMSTLNGSSTLRSSISSIINQSFQDWELIICNDGSKDQSEEIIKSYCKHDRRIKLLNHRRNEGLSKSLNDCIKLSIGKYIARMDDDDFSKPNRLAAQVEFLDKNTNVDWVGTNISIYDGKRVYGKREMLATPNKFDVWLGHSFVHPSIMIKSDVLKKIDGYNISSEVTRIEDYDLWCKLYSLGYVGNNLQQELLIYREDDGSFEKRDIKRRIRLFKCMKYWRKRLQISFIYFFCEYILLLKCFIPNSLIKMIHQHMYS
ncbi:glycosyltransferase family 2 protein [Bombilactobacillus bombi]|uniref:glycosyltransferase family 2 protein n=1 Tax=Bombilactobacillus bombi TaxID=1303590 RepID=UPI0015E5E874|nr:glycosyltransferase [Bombilactobacillus bombi]MBA1434939.1 glycosyltransferase [Bombilactobacillus bombi]